MEKYTVSGFVFDTKEEALAAKKELKAIQTICQKLDVTKPKYAKAVHDRIIDKNMFQTVAGEEFLKSLELVYKEETVEPEDTVQKDTVSAGSEEKAQPVSAGVSEPEEEEQLKIKEPEPEQDAASPEEMVLEKPEIRLEASEQGESAAEKAAESEESQADEETAPEKQDELFQQDIILDSSYFEEEAKPEPQEEKPDYVSIHIDDDYEEPQIHIEEDEQVPAAGDSVSLEEEDEQPEWKKQALEALYDDEDDLKKKKKEKKKKNYQEFENDYDIPQAEEEAEEEKPESRHYRGLFFNSFVLNLVLIAAIVFLILVAFNSENANMLNYERVLNNRYEQKEQQLEQEYESLKLELQNAQEEEE